MSTQMIGCNELHLCEAEVMVAMQEYINIRFGQYAPIVNSIDVEKDHGSKTFVIKLVSRGEQNEQ